MYIWTKVRLWVELTATRTVITNCFLKSSRFTMNWRDIQRIIVTTNRMILFNFLYLLSFIWKEIRRKRQKSVKKLKIFWNKGNFVWDIVQNDLHRRIGTSGAEKLSMESVDEFVWDVLLFIGFPWRKRRIMCQKTLTVFNGLTNH